MRRGVGAAAIVAAAVAIATTSGTQPVTGAPGGASAAPPVPRWDADGDGVFETLERQLADPQRQDRFEVVVVLDEPATPARIAALQEAVGAFEVTQRYASFPAFAATLQRRQVR
jgi:hypothetical protein